MAKVESSRSVFEGSEEAPLAARVYNVRIDEWCDHSEGNVVGVDERTKILLRTNENSRYYSDEIFRTKSGSTTDREPKISFSLQTVFAEEILAKQQRVPLQTCESLFPPPLSFFYRWKTIIFRVIAV